MATGISYVIVILDTSIVNVALERITTGLAAGMTGLQWVLNAYTLTFASLLLTGGTLGDRLGARNIYIVGLGAFTLASALCGFAFSLPMLIAARVLQGVGAALLVPASMSLINRSWNDARERAAVFGLWAGLGGIAMAIGPLLGGILIGLSDWRSIFLINVPICLAGMVMACRVTRDTPVSTTRRFDFAGQATGIAALALLNLAIINVPEYGWHSPVIVSCMVGALAAAVAFVMIETTHAQPILPMGLFRSAVFSGAVFASTVSAFTFYGLIFGLSLLLQQQRGYTPMHTGLAFLPLTLLVPVGSLLSKHAVGRLGVKHLVTSAFLLAATGFFSLVAVSTSTQYWLLALPLPAIGFAASLITPATTTALMSTVDNPRAGIASGVLNAARQTGAAFGVALSGTLVSMNHSIALGVRSSAMTAGSLSIFAAVMWWRTSMQTIHKSNPMPG